MKILQTLTSLLASQDFNSDFASFLLPSQDTDPERIKVLDALKGFESMIVIGIGGSNLGTIAVSEALAKNTNGKKLYFLDTPDTEATEDILKEVLTRITHGEKVAITVISKSGSTAETIALADRVYALKESHRENVAIVTISDPDSKLDMLSKNKEWYHLNLPNMVGGRYSVMSNVGLFPLEFI
jgi:glucose-6-phosphate isomerase